MFHMTEAQKKLMFQNKRDFVEDMAITLKGYPEFDVTSIEYKLGEVDEYIRIAYRGGHVSWICVTGDSTGAILGAIANSVRGKFAYGTVLSTRKKNELENKTDWEEL